MAGGATTDITARIAVAAHGSWGVDPLILRKRESQSHDLLGFKGHFEHAALEPDLMPLLTYPGGYGGMVHCDGGRVSLSCCVRRAQLAKLRQTRSGEAGEAVLSHIAEHCRGVREALASARLVGAWLSAGPLRPGLRWPERDGVILVGNAAGEAHPVIAEGISMAMQSSWLLSQKLISWKHRCADITELPQVVHSYAALWRRHFGLRVHLSQLVAHWAMRPALVVCTLPLMRALPKALTWFAQLSGKAHNMSPNRQRGLAYGA